MKRSIWSLTLGAALCAGALPLSAVPVVFSASGSAATDIQGAVDSFRTALGTNNGVGGTFATGRREINWDGVPDGVSAPNNFPGNFFNVNSPRGAVFTTPGSGFQVSATAAVGNIEFDNLAAGNSASFLTFSPQRLFTALGSPITDVNFFLPGTTSPAGTRAFGVVFTDVDLANTTSLQFFGLDGTSLGVFFAPTANNGLSFLGVNLGTDIAARVRITSGNALLTGVETATADKVAMDDFLYGEPQAIPEPSTYAMFASGALLLGVGRWLRSRRVA